MGQAQARPLLAQEGPLRLRGIGAVIAQQGPAFPGLHAATWRQRPVGCMDLQLQQAIARRACRRLEVELDLALVRVDAFALLMRKPDHQHLPARKAGQPARRRLQPVLAPLHGIGIGPLAGELEQAAGPLMLRRLDARLRLRRLQVEVCLLYTSDAADE